MSQARGWSFGFVGGVLITARKTIPGTGFCQDPPRIPLFWPVRPPSGVARAGRIYTFAPWPKAQAVCAGRAGNQVKRMPNRVVVGAQWGDEGKAKVVDFLTEEADVVIRFQGGANAGHT